MVLGVTTPNGRRWPPLFSSLGREWGLRCTKRSCSTFPFSCLKAGHNQQQVYMDPGPCQVLHGEKVWQCYKTNFSDFWPADFCPSSSPDLNQLDIAGNGVLEHFAIKTSHLILISLKAAICVGGAALSGDVLVNLSAIL